MKEQLWIFSVSYEHLEGKRDIRRFAVVGSGHSATVERALCLAGVSDKVRTEICADMIVRWFVEDMLDPEKVPGYYTCSPIGAEPGWVICIGPVHEVLS
jgi:hypothetical protein